MTMTIYRWAALISILPLAVFALLFITCKKNSQILELLLKNTDNRIKHDLRNLMPCIKIPRVSAFGPPRFFLDPYGFLSSWQNLLKLPVRNALTEEMLWFRFSVRDDTVLVPFGSTPRRIILTDRRFDSLMGYSLMTSTIKDLIPTLPDNQVEDGSNPLPSSTLISLFRKVVRTDVMEKYPSMILEDIERELRLWKDKGTLDPFDKLRRLLIIPIIRITLGSEILSDPSRVDQTISGLTAIEEANGLPDLPIRSLLSIWPTIVLMALNPQQAVSVIRKKTKQILAGIGLYRLFSKVIEERRAGVHGVQQEDILHTLLEDEKEGQGGNDRAVVERLIMALFTAGGSSSSVYPWLQIFLCEHPKWKLEVDQEVQDFLREHIPSFTTNPSETSFEDIVQSLSQLSLSTWEDSLPVLERCVRETLRLVLINAIPRKNLGEDIDLAPNPWPTPLSFLSSTKVKKEEFVFYLTSDAHFDEAIYPNALQFDPAREYPTKPTDFLGWGAGLHICTGQRLARVMIKVVTVILMNRFEFELADRPSSKHHERTIPNYRLFGIGQPKNPVLLKYRSRHDKFD